MDVEVLYHTIVTVVDSSGKSRTVYPLGTHGTYEAAKQFAGNALHTLGCAPDNFPVYEGHQPSGYWTHGENVTVYAKTADGTEYFVGLDSEPNTQGFVARPDGTLVLDGDMDHLHYVIETKEDDNENRHATYKKMGIDGCFLEPKDALKMARGRFSGQREEFEQFDERKSLGATDKWPFGEDVLVHAVAATGGTYTVAVKTPPGTIKKLGRR